MAMHKACTTCAQAVHRFGAFSACLALLACSTARDFGTDGAAGVARDQAVPIGAIQRFEPAKFDGRWVVQSALPGAWDVASFSVSDAGTTWREVGPQGAARADIAVRATGILRLDYDAAMTRDLWVVWMDPDHNTVALGNPAGDVGVIATRAGQARADQQRAAAQVLDFNGYRTETWGRGAQ
ncbi:MAG: hypothetical protein AAF727_05255 [Pseudomonadota bacterium]